MRCILIALAALLSLATADVSFTQPTTATIWKAGAEVEAHWQPAPNKTVTPDAPVTVELLYGDPKALTSLGTVGHVVPEKAQSVRFVLSDRFPAGNQYVLRAGSVYSAMFTIISDKAAASNSTAGGANKTSTGLVSSGANSSSSSNNTANSTNAAGGNDAPSLGLSLAASYLLYTLCL